METTIMGYIRVIGYILGLYWDNGNILGLCVMLEKQEQT